MKLPIETKPALLGAAAGAIALAIVGFSWGGWVTGGSAELNAKQRSEQAVVAALTPGCVAQFRAGADADIQLVALKKANTWEQGTFIEKGGWANMPGSAKANSDLARSCADALGKATP